MRGAGCRSCRGSDGRAYVGALRAGKVRRRFYCRDAAQLRRLQTTVTGVLIVVQLKTETLPVSASSIPARRDAGLRGVPDALIFSAVGCRQTFISMKLS